MRIDEVLPLHGLRRRDAWLALALLLAAMLVLMQACGGGADKTKAHVRLVNASSGYESLSLNIDGTAVNAGAGYADVSRGNQTLDVYSPGSAAALKSLTADLGKDSHYTLLAYGKAGALATFLLDDNAGAAAAGKAQVRMVNTASDAGAVDVYLIGDSDPLASATPLQSNLTFGALAGPTAINSGTWRLLVTGAGDKTDIRLSQGGLVFGSTSVSTLVLTPGKNSRLLNAQWLSQQGPVTAYVNSQARLRVVAGVGDRAAVTVKVRGVPLMDGVAAPTLTDYSLVNAGTAVPVDVSAASAVAGLTTLSLAGGGDYTLLVWGTAASPQATLIEDDNSLPSDPARVKLRLVHGVAGVSAALSLKLNLVLTTTAPVAQGSASSYALVAPSTSVELGVSSSDNLMKPYTSAERVLQANSVYTLFILGAAQAPEGALNKDR